MRCFMVVIRRKRKILGREDNTGVLVKGGKVVPATQTIIDAANAELRKKCARQRENDAEASIAAHDMIAGQSYSFIAIEGASVIRLDFRELAEMDFESIKRSNEQRVNEVGLEVIAHDMISGGLYDDVANGPVLTKKRR